MSQPNANFDELEKSTSHFLYSSDDLNCDSIAHQFNNNIPFDNPGIVKAISRRLSAATPPEKESITHSSPTPEGSQQVAILAATPPGSDEMNNNCSHSGGVAALNHRLMAAIPSGSKSDDLPSQIIDQEPLRQFRETVSLPRISFQVCYEAGAIHQRLLEESQVKS